MSGRTPNNAFEYLNNIKSILSATEKEETGQTQMSSSNKTPENQYK